MVARSKWFFLWNWRHLNQMLWNMLLKLRFFPRLPPQGKLYCHLSLERLCYKLDKFSFHHRIYSYKCWLFLELRTNQIRQWLYFGFSRLLHLWVFRGLHSSLCCPFWRLLVMSLIHYSTLLFCHLHDKSVTWKLSLLLLVNTNDSHFSYFPRLT